MLSIGGSGRVAEADGAQRRRHGRTIVAGAAHAPDPTGSATDFVTSHAGAEFRAHDERPGGAAAAHVTRGRAHLHAVRGVRQLRCQPHLAPAHRVHGRARSRWVVRALTSTRRRLSLHSPSALPLHPLHRILYTLAFSETKKSKSHARLIKPSGLPFSGLASPESALFSLFRRPPPASFSLFLPLLFSL